MKCTARGIRCYEVFENYTHSIKDTLCQSVNPALRAGTEKAISESKMARAFNDSSFEPLCRDESNKSLCEAIAIFL